MKSLFISATNTNIGKTYSTHLIAKHLNAQGVKCLIAKPIETGDNGNEMSEMGEMLDCQKHHQYNLSIDKTLRLEDINFYRYKLPASPFVAQKYEPLAQKVDLHTIAQKLHALESKCDVLLIEGAGGLMVPIDEKHTMLDLAMFLKAPLLVISSDRLGMINDLALNIALLNSKNIPHIFAINLIDEQTYNTITKPYIDYLNTKLPNPIYILQKDIPKIASDFFSFS